MRRRLVIMRGRLVMMRRHVKKGERYLNRWKGLFGKGIQKGRSLRETYLRGT